MDSMVAGHDQALHPEAEVVRADVRDEESLNRAFAGHNFDAVIHYGGYIQAGESVQQPGRYFANNIGGTIALLNAIVAFGVNRFVFSSSAGVYGQPDDVPIREEAPMRPVSPYGETKAAVERMLPWYERQYDLHYVSLRYFNAAGGTGSRGEDHRPETHLIPSVLQVALGQRPALPLFGDDYPTPDGTCVRDYVHVSDLAAAHLLAIEYAGSGSGAFNLGNGRGFSNLQVIETARRVAGHEIPVNQQPRRPGDPAELVASQERARNELGWRPVHTELEEIVESAWRWHEAHPRGYEG